MDSLSVFIILSLLFRLLLLEGGPGSPSCLLGGKHIVSWGYEDMLPAPDSNTGSSSESKGNIRALVPWLNLRCEKSLDHCCKRFRFNSVFLLVKSSKFLYSVFIVCFISKSIKADTQWGKKVDMFYYCQGKGHPYTPAKEEWVTEIGS